MNAWLERAPEVIARIAATQGEPIERAAAICAGAIGADSVVYAFGTGHSRIPVEEMFPRYCSFSGFVPMVELSTTFYTPVIGANGLRQAMWIERQSGLADQIAASWDLQPPAAMMIFSAGGTNAAPREMAAAASARGLPVIAVTAVPAKDSPVAGRPHLSERADVVVDLCASDAEGLVVPNGAGVPIGAATTLAYVCVVNAIKVRTAELLIERGALPPVIAHPGAVGEEASLRSIDDALADHARRLRLAAAEGEGEPA